MNPKLVAEIVVEVLRLLKGRKSSEARPTIVMIPKFPTKPKKRKRK